MIDEHLVWNCLIVLACGLQVTIPFCLVVFLAIPTFAKEWRKTENMMEVRGHSPRRVPLTVRAYERITRRER